MNTLVRLSEPLGEAVTPRAAPEARKLRVLIADDHALVRDAIAQIMRAGAGHEVMVADTLAAAQEIVRRDGAVDIVLLDLNMPDMEGIRSIEAMARLPGIGAVVLFSGSAPRDLVLQALTKGARGFIPKSMRLAAFLNALNMVSLGEIYLPASMLGTLPHMQRAGAEPAGLNGKEVEVLRYVTEGLSNKEIARRIDLTEVRVKMHMRALCKKLGVANRTGAAMKARELGLC